MNIYDTTVQRSATQYNSKLKAYQGKSNALEYNLISKKHDHWNKTIFWNVYKYRLQPNGLPWSNLRRRKSVTVDAHKASCEIATSRTIEILQQTFLFWEHLLYLKGRIIIFE